MNEDQIIAKLKDLKQISPSRDWAFSLKAQILKEKPFGVTQGRPVGLLQTLQGFLYNKRIAYSFAVLLLFVAVGIYGVSSLSAPAPALLASEAELKNDFKIVAEKSNNLAEVIEKEPQKVDQAVEEVKVAMKKVTESIKKDHSLAKTVASEIRSRTYLTVAGREDLEEAHKDYYTVTLQALLDYYSNVEALAPIKASYSNGEIDSALGLELALQALHNPGE